MHDSFFPKATVAAIFAGYLACTFKIISAYVSARIGLRPPFHHYMRSSFLACTPPSHRHKSCLLLLSPAGPPPPLPPLAKLDKLGGGFRPIRLPFLPALASVPTLPTLPHLVPPTPSTTPSAVMGMGTSSCGTARKPPKPLPTTTLFRASPPKPPFAHCGPRPRDAL